MRLEMTAVWSHVVTTNYHLLFNHQHNHYYRYTNININFHNERTGTISPLNTTIPTNVLKDIVSVIEGRGYHTQYRSIIKQYFICWGNGSDKQILSFEGPRYSSLHSWNSLHPLRLYEAPLGQKEKTQRGIESRRNRIEEELRQRRIWEHWRCG